MAWFNPTYSEELDLAQVLFVCRGLLAVAVHGGLPTGMYTKDGAGQVDALLAANNILDVDLKLCAPFRAVMENVLGNRDTDAMTAEDCRAIAARTAEWHPDEFGTGWSMAVYRLR